MANTPQQATGTITRKSNGSLEFIPTDAGAFGRLPAMGDEVTIDITVTRTAAEAEKAAREHKAARTGTATADVIEPAARRAPR